MSIRLIAFSRLVILLGLAIWLSIAIGYLSCLGGLLISYRLNVPSGASIIFFSILIYIACKIGKSLFRKKQ